MSRISYRSARFKVAPATTYGLVSSETTTRTKKIHGRILVAQKVTSVEAGRSSATLADSGMIARVLLLSLHSIPAEPVQRRYQLSTRYRTVRRKRKATRGFMGLRSHGSDE